MIAHRRVVCLVVMALALFAFDRGWAQATTEPLASPLRVTANDCKSCHPRNYQEWEQSYHAKSVVSMLAGFKKYITTQEQAKGRPLTKDELMGCIGCHAPAMRFAGDAEFTHLANLVKNDQRQQLTGLSVDCVACHALVGSGHPEVKPPEQMAQQVYFATIRNPVSTGHGTSYAPQMGTSEFCKNCHTYVTPADMKVNADWDIVCSLTFDAWEVGPHGPKASSADIKQCQSCHMEKQDGKAADVASAPSRQVSSHLFPGWHDAAALRRATEISLAIRTGTAAELVVTIDNKAGHRLPDT